jgi:HEAT repeat protein
MDFEHYWAELNTAGWFDAYRPSTVQQMRETLERDWAQNPASTVYSLGRLAYDWECLSTDSDGCEKALRGYGKISDGLFEPMDILFERAKGSDRARLSFTFKAQRFSREFAYLVGEVEPALDALTSDALERTGSPYRFYTVPSADLCSVALATPAAYAAVKNRGWLRVRPLPGGNWGAILEHADDAVQRLMALSGHSGRGSGMDTVAILVEHAAARDSVVREWAAEALGTVEDPRAMQALFQLLLDGDRHVRESSLKALERTGALEADDLAGRLRPLIEAALGSAEWQRREAAVQLLGRLGDRAPLALLVRCLADPHSAVRSAAESTLRRVNAGWAGTDAAREAVPNLLAALQDGRAIEGQRGAVNALGEIRDRRAVEPLIALLTQEGLESLQALRKIDPERSFRHAIAARLPSLLAALAGQGGSAYQAHQALEELGRERPRTPAALAQIPALVTRLPAGLEWQRTMIARALGWLGHPQAIQGLFRALFDPAPTVAAEAAAALDAITPDWPRHESVQREIPGLIEGLQRETSPNWRFVTATVLGRTGDQSAVGILVPLLSDSDTVVVAAAASSLGLLQARTAVEALAALLLSEEFLVRRAAMRALRRIERRPRLRRLRTLLSRADTPPEMASALLQWLGIPPFG